MRAYLIGMEAKPLAVQYFSPLPGHRNDKSLPCVSVTQCQSRLIRTTASETVAELRFPPRDGRITLQIQRQKEDINPEVPRAAARRALRNLLLYHLKRVE